MTYHTQYRPSTFAEVVGQAQVIKSLGQALGSGVRAFLFTGPSGVGKTTIARIIGWERSAEVIEIDGATETGVERMRRIVDSAVCMSLQADNKVVIVDECHQLSKQTWQSLLKVIEEPPEHLTWVFCTTELSKVPQTIRTRCVEYELRDLTRAEVKQVLDPVIDNEGIELSDEMRDFVLDEARGSARRALTILAKVQGCLNVQEAASLVAREAPTPEAYDLARLIFSGSFNLLQATRMLEKMKDQGSEGVRIVVTAYANSVFLGAKDAAAARKALDVLSAFEQPCDPLTKIAPVSLRIGRLLHKWNKM